MQTTSYYFKAIGELPKQVGGGLNPSSKPGCQYELDGCWDGDFTNVLDHLSREAGWIIRDRRLGVVSPTLVHPQTGKSISIALAFALRACVRASEAACARWFQCG